jgi:transposase
VALASTGSVWKPLVHRLERDREIQVVNAAPLQPVPGRKTAVGDAAWIAGVLRHGVLRPRFIPTRAQRALRERTRSRRSLVDERSAAGKRRPTVVEDANLQGAGIATDSRGTSGREMLERSVAGETAAPRLAPCAPGRRQAKIPLLEAALAGAVDAQHRWRRAPMLARIDDLDAVRAEWRAQLAARRAPDEDRLVWLDTMPGVGRQTVEHLLAEIGTDLGQCPAADHLASGAGRAPGHHESAGTRQRGQTRKGSRWRRATLVVAAQAAGRGKQTALGARYRAVAARRGKQRAAVAVGPSSLLAVYPVRADHQPSDERRQLRKPPRPAHPAHLVQQLQARAFEVPLQPLDPAA